MVNFNYESDQPLDSADESLIDQVSARKYLSALITRFGIKMNADVSDLSDFECRRIIRVLFRNASDHREVIQ